MIICQSSYGSLRWFAVEFGQETHPMNAAWLCTGVTAIETQAGTVTTDGRVRFFARKRDVLAAIARTKAEATQART